ncbi:uncharacterized protein DS421_19g662350 [Arachis hypogaea]|uniref:Uncharacterized protein n=1 Tax=Arachis hypogaea TaxID=3818 RepID=A0A6B9VAK1_ARAHY|nr:uncharacterized protein DS421_19g662350 [Arachis hypogaea]
MWVATKVHKKHYMTLPKPNLIFTSITLPLPLSFTMFTLSFLSRSSNTVALYPQPVSITLCRSKEPRLLPPKTTTPNLTMGTPEHSHCAAQLDAPPQTGADHSPAVARSRVPPPPPRAKDDVHNPHEGVSGAPSLNRMGSGVIFFEISASSYYWDPIWGRIVICGDIQIPHVCPF